jgi:ribosomal-protein-alanine N-acetyltransferase
VSNEIATQGPAEEALPGLRVRPLLYGDLPAVLALERRSFPTPWSLAMFVLEISKPSGICLGIAGEQGLVGYLVCSRYGDVWHLMNIAVDPDRRRQGIGRALMLSLFEAAGPGARFTLEVRTSNAAAIRMYERFSFRPAGHRRRYYHDNGEDALIMWLQTTRATSSPSAPGVRGDGP